MSKAANPETNVGEHITLLTYAALDDIERAKGDEGAANPCSVQTYGNLMKKAADRCVGVKSRASYTTEVKQVLSTILTLMIDELDSADLDEIDPMPAIVEKATTVGNIAAFVFKTAASNATRLGPVLVSAADQKRWVNGVIAGRSPTLAKAPRLSKVISDAYEAFLKAVAWMVGQSLPYISPRTSVAQPLFLSTLAQLGLAHVEIGDLITSIRPRPPVKRKTAPKKKDAAATADVADTTDAADDEDEDEDGLDAI